MKPKMSFRDWCIQNHAYLLLHFIRKGTTRALLKKSDFPPESV